MLKLTLGLWATALILWPLSLLADARADFEKALEEYKACRFEEAKRGFERFLQFYPRDRNIPRALYNLAQLESNSRDAVTYYQRIVSEYPESGVADSALFRTGLYRMASGEYSQAAETFTGVLARYPETALRQTVRYWLALSYLAVNDRVSAIGELKEVVNISSSSEYSILAKRDLERLEQGLKPLPEVTALPKVSPEGQYMVQVGSFSDFQVALALRRRLEQRGYPIAFGEIVVDEQTFYRVRVGPYSTQGEAKAVGERLAREEHLQCWIVKIQP